MSKSCRMQKYVPTFLILAGCIVLFSAGQAQTTIFQTKSKVIYEDIRSGNVEAHRTSFDTTGLGVATRNQYIQLLKDLYATHGKAQKLLGYWEDEQGSKTKTASLIRFKKDSVMLYLVFNAARQIQHVQFGEATRQPFYILKGYKGLAEVTDLSTSFRTHDGLVLGAHIAFSDTSKKIPLAILVHGSGPNDRDESIGPNKVFRDLAQGLAQRGIATLRYDKRTYAYQFDMKPRSDSMTLYTETINDAVDAVKQASRFTFIDTNRIYIIGHSQGAYCASKIAELDPRIKAIVMMGSPARSLVDIIPEQIEYLAMLDDTLSKQEQMNITSVKWMVNKIRQPDKFEKPGILLLGASRIYWNSILNYDPVETAKKLTIPVYIMNGERDYQITMKEFELWKQALKEQNNVRFTSYPGLSHLFIEGKGKPGPEEYDIPGHIPQQVIDDISDFLLKK